MMGVASIIVLVRSWACRSCAIPPQVQRTNHHAISSVCTVGALSLESVQISTGEEDSGFRRWNTQSVVACIPAEQNRFPWDRYFGYSIPKADPTTGL